MQKRIADAKKDTVVEIPELVGGKDQLRARKIEERLRKECDARGKIHVDCRLCLRSLESRRLWMLTIRVNSVA